MGYQRNKNGVLGGRRLFARRKERAIVSVTGGEGNWLIQLELEHGFSRHFDFFSFGQNLRGTACGRAGYSSDHSAFAATCDGSQESAENGAPTHHFGGALVFADSRVALLIDIRGADYVVASVYSHRIQIECEFRTIGRAAGRNLTNYQLRVGIFGDQDLSRTSFHIIYNYRREGLSLGGAIDYRFDGRNTVTVGNNWAWAVAGYASYQATEKLKLNARLDYTEGSDGTYYNRAGGPRQNRLGAATLTADYALWANVISRAEFRWDHSMSCDKPYGGTGATPIPPANTGVNRNAVSLALNLIYKF